jgi:hypothetical protein
MMEKARRHSGLKNGHHQLNGEKAITLALNTGFISGSSSEVTFTPSQEDQFAGSVVTSDFQGRGKTP